jgi:Transcriptional regulator
MAATEHSQQIKQDSKDYLITALLDLLQTKTLNDITVTQVVKKAGVSRMAFYRNFQTLDDILIAYFKPKIDAEFNQVLKRIPQDQKLNALGDFFNDLSETMTLAVKRNYEFIIQNIFNENMLSFYDQAMDWDNFSEIQKRYWIRFMSAGVYSIWREWLISGQRESLNDIHVLIADFQTSTLQALANEKRN